MRNGAVIGLMVIILGVAGYRQKTNPELASYGGSYVLVTDGETGRVTHTLTLRPDMTAEFRSSDEANLEVPVLTGIWLVRGTTIDVSLARAGTPARSLSLNLARQDGGLVVRAALGSGRELAGLTFTREAVSSEIPPS